MRELWGQILFLARLSLSGDIREVIGPTGEKTSANRSVAVDVIERGHHCKKQDLTPATPPPPHPPHAPHASAMTRSGLPLPRTIFSGAAMTIAPVAGN